MNSLFSAPLAVFGLGTTELVLIVFAILLIFGGAKLPSLARGLGQSIREFKKASHEEDDAKADVKPEAPKADVSKSSRN